MLKKLTASRIEEIKGYAKAGALQSFSYDLETGKSDGPKPYAFFVLRRKEGMRGSKYGIRSGTGLAIAAANDSLRWPVPLSWCSGDNWEELAQYADELNQELFGIDPTTAAKIVDSSRKPTREQERREAHAINPTLCGPRCGCQR